MTHLVTPAEQPICEDPNAGVLWERLLESHPHCAELLEALDAVRHHAHEATGLEDEARRRADLVDDLRASYPDADEEDIDDWVWGETSEPPPVLRRAGGFWDRAPEEPELSRLAS
jgi:hypothetical protein